MTEPTINETPLSPLEARRVEVAQYETNIAVYNAILESHTDVWPDRLTQYRSAVNRHETVSQIENLDDVLLISRLWTQDDARKAIRSEMLEMTKSKAILAVLEAQV